MGSTVTSDQAELQIFGNGNVFKTACLYQSDLMRPLDIGKVKLSLYQRSKSRAGPDQILDTKLKFFGLTIKFSQKITFLWPPPKDFSQNSKSWQEFTSFGKIMTRVYFISRMPRERKKLAPDRSGNVIVSPEIVLCHWQALNHARKLILSSIILYSCGKLSFCDNIVKDQIWD